MSHGVLAPTLKRLISSGGEGGDGQPEISRESAKVATGPPGSGGTRWRLAGHC